MAENHGPAALIDMSFVLEESVVAKLLIMHEVLC